MIRPRALFRFDASPTIGGGHAYRCLTLARALVEVGWEVAIASRRDTLAMIPSARQFVVLDLDGLEDREANDIAKVVEPVDLLVVDHYRRGVEFEAAARSWARHIFVIDDLADRRHECDILLDQTFGRLPTAYHQLVPGDCQLLLGAQYALLRPQFCVARAGALARRKTGALGRILVAAGASDPSNLTNMALSGIAYSGLDVEVDVVLGAKSPNLEAVRTQIGPMQNVRLHVDAENMAELMMSAGLAIGAAGSMSWERCSLGLPTLMIVTADNQDLVALNLHAFGAARFLGRTSEVSAAVVAEQLEQLAGSSDQLRKMSEHAAAICDGRGIQRALLSLAKVRVAKDGKITRLRLAEESDSATILGWQSAEGARRYMLNPAVPSADEHQAWMEEKLGSPDCLLCLIERNGVPAGILRLDKEGELSWVSILVAPDHQMHGIGSAALEIVSELAPGLHLAARILEENHASIRLFSRAGYRQERDGLYHRRPISN